MRKLTIWKKFAVLVLLVGLIFVFNLIARYFSRDVSENVTEKELRSIEIVSVEPKEVIAGDVSVITFVTKREGNNTGGGINSGPAKWLKGDNFSIYPNMSGGKILSIERAQKSGYYIVKYQSPMNPFFTRSYPIEISIGLELYDGYERNGRFFPLKDSATVIVFNPKFITPVDITLKRTGDLKYAGSGASLYKGICEQTSDCKVMYNFVPWNTKDGLAIEGKDAVQLECVASRCVLPNIYRTIGVWCNEKTQCDTGRKVKFNAIKGSLVGKDYPELVCDVSNERCVGAMPGVNCITLNRDPFIGPIDFTAVERCDRGLVCEEKREVCKYDFGSFVTGTIVVTPHGPRSIESLVPGDLVVSFDIESQKNKTSAVQEQRVRTVSEYYLINDSLKVTAEHPIAVRENGGIVWRKVQALRVRDVLVSYSGGGVVIEHIDKVSGLLASVSVYNPGIADGTYYVVMNNVPVLVHNKSIPPYKIFKVRN